MSSLSLAQLLQSTADSRWLRGLCGAGRGWFLSKWIEHYKKPVLVVAKGPREAEALFTDLNSFCGGQYEVLYFPEWEELIQEGVIGSLDLLGERWQVLEKLNSLHRPFFFVTSIGAVLHGLLAVNKLAEIRQEISPGRDISRERLFKWLLDNGYDRVDCVELKGEFTQRGGIIDVFSPASEWPLRIELVGETIESLRFFHPQTQRSLVEEEVPPYLYPVDEPAVYQRQYGALANIACFFRNGLVVLDEPLELQQRAQELEQLMPQFINWQDWWQGLADQQRIIFSLFTQGENELVVFLRSLDYLTAEKKTPDLAAAAREAIFRQLSQWLAEKYQVDFWCNNLGEKERLQELLREKKISRHLQIQIGRISSGFVYPEERLVVISDEEIFGRYKVRLPRRKFSGYGVPLKEFTELQPGDYVVHLDHGIGKYLGIKKEKDGESLVIQYADKAKLYVPIDQAYLIERYLGLSARPPRLNQLGGRRWLATKLKVEKALKDMAAELLDLQARRQAQPGISYGRDTLWQREMEEAFIYEETPDQLQAVSEVKADMELSRPMDRLLCGDVGYGKTEVAVRAAFKAVMAEKQVAVLVPTTILAQQHCRTFQDRLADYPVRVEMLSRFRSDREQREIIADLAVGRIDIVIGTHRLIQPDVKFKDLGLVVVDEEQRFGVRHKERLKKLRAVVDLLTLTATPIPRTLYMSLVGLRDMSVINTPPQDRLAVRTIVTAYSEELIRKAILREINREGQVYFLHNRVETIEKVTRKLQQLIPEAKFITGHGQMDEDLLALVMDEFVQGKADVLVCTTIIQSGLDIPNVNTIIINDAQRLGLADLYQLRGRVGRFKHQAYAYLLLPQHAVLVGTAKKRLKAIQDFSHLGAGFKIAMQDLEIRGAGNILGSQQHGYIQAVGFDMYCKLLRKNVAKLKGEFVEEVYEVRLDISQQGYLPIDYIPSDRIRIDFYKRIAGILSRKELADLSRELIDRFGPLPGEAKMLLNIVMIKLLAVQARLKEIKEFQEKFYIIGLDGKRVLLEYPGGKDKLKWLKDKVYAILTAKGIKGGQIK